MSTARWQKASFGPSRARRRAGSYYQPAQTQLRQAEATLKTATARLGYAEITAPRDGVLIARNVENGAVTPPRTVLLVLARAGQTQLFLEIDERSPNH